MKLSVKILLSYFIILGAVAYSILSFVSDETKPLVRQSAEDVLVDTSYILASIISDQNDSSTIVVDKTLEHSLRTFTQQQLNAEIWGMKKNNIKLHIYITDEKGIVLFDSLNRYTGMDFSQWNDIYLTLQGKYGARTSRSNPDDPATSVLYIAAPIRYQGNIVGAVSIGKPGAAIAPYIKRAENKLIRYSILLFLFCLSLGGFFVWRLSQRISRLHSYANQVAEGENPATPEYRIKDEISDLAIAVSSMKAQLEGKNYIENYVQILSHEFKSPLSAISASAEILHDDIETPQLKELAKNIEEQSSRLNNMIHKMLEQTRLEQRTNSHELTDTLNFSTITSDWQQSRQMLLQKKKIRFSNTSSTSSHIKGSSWLMQKAISNVLDNALEYAPMNGEISITSSQEKNTYRLNIFNSGSVIPEYALPRIFEKFYSLPKEGGKTSTGLGLSFVQEVMHLHQADVQINNIYDSSAQGVSVTLTFKG